VGDSTQRRATQLLGRGLWEAVASGPALTLDKEGWRALFIQVSCLELE